MAVLVMSMDEITATTGPLYECRRPHLIAPRQTWLLADLGEYFDGDFEPAALIAAGLCPWCPDVHLGPGGPCSCCGQATAECSCCGSRVWVEGGSAGGEWGSIPGRGLVEVDDR